MTESVVVMKSVTKTVSRLSRPTVLSDSNFMDTGNLDGENYIFEGQLLDKIVHTIDD